MLGPGDSVLVPLNCVPCVVGLALDPSSLKPIWPGSNVRRKADTEPYSAFLVQAVFDSKLDLSHTVEATASAVASFVSGMRHLPSAIRPNEGVEQWRAALEKRNTERHDQ